MAKNNLKFAANSFFCLVLMTFILFFSSCNSDFGTLTRLEKESLEDGVLVMVYMAGANSLSSEVVTDLNNMEMGLYNAPANVRRNLHVVALCDQMSKEIQEDTEGNFWNGTRLYEIRPNNKPATYWTQTGQGAISNIESKQVVTASSSLGDWRTSAEQEEDMGDINTLKNFMYWAIEKYPYCSKHILILWDHGQGVSSKYFYDLDDSSESGNVSKNVCSDDETVAVKSLREEAFGTTLYIDEIHEFLKTLYSQDNKLEMIGFDACFMGLYEVAYEFRDVAKYMAASPATEIGGWGYQYIFANESSILNGKNFAMNVVDAYKSVDRTDGKTNTMTAFDLSYIEELKEKLDSLSGNVGDHILYYVSKTIIDEIQSNVVFLSPRHNQETDRNFPYYELGSYLDYFANNNPSLIDYGDEVKASVEEVRDIMKLVVLNTWLSQTYGNKAEKNIPYGIGIFGGTKNYQSDSYYSRYGFYTDYLYDDPDTPIPVLGYGGIDAANLGNVSGVVQTWRELQNLIYTAKGF